MTPILTENSFDMITHSAKQTHALGERVGRLLAAGDVVCLEGELGSGKTCLTQGIGAGLHVRGTVRSPTFVLVNEHQPVDSGPALYHIDLYRLQDAQEALALGLEDYIYGDGVTVIEWAERAAEVMPEERLWIKLTYLGEMKRSLLFEAQGQRYRALLMTLRQQLFRQVRSEDSQA